MTDVACNHAEGGVFRAFVELHRTPSGWTALGFMVRSMGTPVVAVTCPDATIAMGTAASEIAETAAENEEILEEPNDG